VTRITLRAIALLAVAVSLALPGAALAKKKKRYAAAGSTATLSGSQHGIGPGGVPALRDEIYRRIGLLDSTVLLLDERVKALEEQVAALQGLATDDDLDGFTENQGDCDDLNALAYPGAPEAANGIDDDCDGAIDEVDPVTP
jgi:hypothetical protein